MSVVDDLRAVREMLADPKKWTKEAMARDINNKPVMPRDDAAVCYCIQGAMEKLCLYGNLIHCAGQKRLYRMCLALKDVPIIKYFEPDGLDDDVFHAIVHFNDSHQTTHDQVLAAFDAAIESAAFSTEVESVTR